MCAVYRWCKAIFLILPVIFLVVSCGGGDDSNATATVKSVALSTSTIQINTGQTGNTATLTATVIGSNGKPVRNAVVAFNPDGNAVVTPNAVVTDRNGIATASLTYGADRSNRTILVTATAGKVGSNPVSVTIGGTSIRLTIPTGVQQRDTTVVRATVTDADGIGVENLPVSLSSSLRSMIDSQSVNTDTSGQAEFAVTPTETGTDTLTAIIAGASDTQPMTVSAVTVAAISLTTSTSTIRSGSSGNTSTLVAQVTNPNGTPVPGVAVTFTAGNNGSITPAQATTDANGTATGTIGYGPDKSNRFIDVTVQGNNRTAMTKVEVQGTTLGIRWPLETPVGIDTQYAAILSDSDGNPITNVPVAVVVTGNAGLSGSSPVMTGDNGQGAFHVKGTAKGNFMIEVAYGQQSELFAASVGDPFTKIDANGNALPPAHPVWACVRDNVTTVGGAHLWWEVKTNDGSIHDVSKVYTNVSSDAPQYGTPSDASGLIASSNQQALCGSSNWKLPGDSGGSSTDFATLYATVTNITLATAAQWIGPNESAFYWSSLSDPGQTDAVFAVDITAPTAMAAQESLQRTRTAPVRLVRVGQ